MEGIEIWGKGRTNKISFLPDPLAPTQTVSVMIAC
jgi:hypothetical protein